MSEHTKEPWICHRHSTSASIYSEGWGPIAETIDSNTTIGERHANGHRIVDCVNACAGLSDPAALRKEAVEVLESIINSRHVFPTHKHKLEQLLSKLKGNP